MVIFFILHHQHQNKTLFKWKWEHAEMDQNHGSAKTRKMKSQRKLSVHWCENKSQCAKPKTHRNTSVKQTTSIGGCYALLWSFISYHHYLKHYVSSLIWTIFLITPSNGKSTCWMWTMNNEHGTEYQTMESTTKVMTLSIMCAVRYRNRERTA